MKIPRSLQTEVDASYLYARLAATEDDPAIAEVFRQMSDIERGHAEGFLRAGKDPSTPIVLPPPSGRARMLDRLGRIFGYSIVLGVLMDTEKSLSRSMIRAKEEAGVARTGGETNHVRILRSLLENNKDMSAKNITRFESRHRSVGGNALRAGVLGGNDGLVSNFSLVMGVAGATSGEEGVLVAGMAGLLAGALSMALGEWISVKSSQELYENQMQLEREELESHPEGERREIVLIYRAKGIPAEQAEQMADEVLKDTDKAHELLVREELGIQPEELEGSAMEAAAYSFFLFAIGAIIPVVPFFFATGFAAIAWSVALSAAGLFGIGAAITLFTGKSVWWSGLRQVLFGLAAAAITFGIGKWIGVSLG